MLIGYARVSAEKPNCDPQVSAIRHAGVTYDNLYVDYTDSATSRRPHWDVCRKILRPGDTLVTTRLSHIGRSTAHLMALLDDFRYRGIEFMALDQGIDTTTTEAQMLYRMLAAVAEFQRDLAVVNTRQGLSAARARGRTGGRKPRLTPAQARDAQQKYDSQIWTVQQIADLYGVPRTTVYNHLNRSDNRSAEEEERGKHGDPP